MDGQEKEQPHPQRPPPSDRSQPRPCLSTKKPSWKPGHTHLSRFSLWASILQSCPLVCGASRLLQSFCRMGGGMLKAPGPVMVVMVLAGSSRGRSMPVGSCKFRRRNNTALFPKTKASSVEPIHTALLWAVRREWVLFFFLVRMASSRLTAGTWLRTRGTFRADFAQAWEV